MKKGITIAASAGATVVLLFTITGGILPPAGAQMYGAPTLTITPGNATVNTGNSQFFVAIYDPDGFGSQQGQNVTSQTSWGSSNTSIASSQGSGSFLGQGIGTVTITASYQGMLSQAFLTVNQYGGNSGGLVETRSATEVTQTSARLNALANSNNISTNVWFEYGTTQSFGQTSGSQFVSSGSYSQNVSVLISNLQTNTTYYFRAVAQNQYGTNYGNVLTFSTGNPGTSGQPQVTTQQATNTTQTSATLQGIVNLFNYNYGYNYPSYVATVWFEYGTTLSLGQMSPLQTLNGITGQQTISAFINNLSPGTLYYFRIAAQNQFGVGYGSVLSFTTSGYYGGSGGGYGQGPIVYTRTVADVSQTSATFRGAISPVSGSANVWFEYGTTRNLGRTIGYQSVGYQYQPGGYTNSYSYQDFQTYGSGLAPNTTYYYRAAGQDNSGTNFGAITSFRTLGSSVAPPPPPPPPPYTPPPSPMPPSPSGNPPPSGTTSVSLTPIIDKAQPIDPSVNTTHPKPGELLNYTLAYRNTGTGSISNLILTLILPPEVDYVSSEPASAGMSANGIAVTLANLGPNSEGVALFKLRVKPSATSGTMLAIVSILNYLDGQNRPQSVSGNTSVAVGDSNDDAASITPNLNNLGGSLSLWLLILIFIMIVVQFAYTVMRDREQRTVRSTTTRYTPPTNNHYGTYTSTTTKNS